MPKFFIAGILIFLLLAAAGSSQTTQAARYIPWDCSDWQAFAHDDRATAILESLAENRGKTLYCGIDQSDTFAKAETWAAGRDRNERDGTVYWGERGNFRGFIAAQEGWLTDGESGITGQSIAHIFEFPQEERKRRRKVKEYRYDVVPTGTWYHSWWYGPEAPGADMAAARAAARSAFDANPPPAEFHRFLRSNREDNRSEYRHGEVDPPRFPGLDAFCRSLGYTWATNIRARIDSTWSGIYNDRQEGTSPNIIYYATARRAVEYDNVDCFRYRRR